ncbi:hypothetical protein HEAR0700 [Herminiimonas arsenicoxydans]|uniref:AAA+ ATPase domain-containing protein n=1 Tax=Herminiimonas arsenicoxydans TaxID=204773 RepID=A4G307_HERAR|nr:hypothetical protein HEAR0700 [Herminiimonas arsenicoxydans]
MRAAQVNDVWREALGSQKGLIRLDKLTTNNIKGIGDKTISFPHRITALCGENGAGKTSLLTTLFSALTPNFAKTLGVALRPLDNTAAAGAIATVSLRQGSNTTYLESGDALFAELKDNSEDCMVAYLDAAAASQRLKYIVSNDNDFPSALDGTPQGADDASLLQLRAEITGRRYTSVITHELDDYADESVFPYFIVSVGDITYRSEEMGLGELCINYLIWAIGRVRANSIVLFEEPESHLPPRAQEALMAFIAKTAVEKKLTVVVSTHSQHTLSNIPPAHITLLARSRGDCITNANPRRSVLFESLRVATPKQCILFLEDHSAAAFLEGLMFKIDPDLAERVEVSWGNGWSDIDEVLGRLPVRKLNTQIVGIYDGDQRSYQRPLLHWPHAYLPGNFDPLHFMVNSVESYPEKLADALKCDRGMVEMAVANVSATDQKDFFVQLSTALGYGYHIDTLYRASTNVWLEQMENEAEVISLIQFIKKYAY